MSERDPHAAGAERADESFLGRWSRLKAQAREREANPAPEPVETRNDAPPAVVAATPEPAPPAIELPDLEQLDQDSDYSAFLTPGVDAALRQRALRKLFSSPKFNVFDGLDTYRDDFTSFPPLGDVVTADMRHHIERLARELAARSADEPPVAPPAVAATEGSTSAAPEPAADPPPARTDDDANHGPA